MDLTLKDFSEMALNTQPCSKCGNPMYFISESMSMAMAKLGCFSCMKWEYLTRKQLFENALVLEQIYNHIPTGKKFGNQSGVFTYIEGMGWFQTGEFKYPHDEISIFTVIQSRRVLMQAIASGDVEVKLRMV